MSEFTPLLFIAIAAIVILRIMAKVLKVPYTRKFLVVFVLVLIVALLPFPILIMLPIVFSFIGSAIILFLIYYYREKIFTKKITNWLRK